MRRNGRVKWFNVSRGVGCIEADNGEQVGVRAGSIVGEGVRTLEEGQSVEFEMARGPEGLLAERVVPIGEALE